jgi:hypothetical protein
MAEVQGERLRAEQELGRHVPGEQLMPIQIRALIAGVRDAVALLAQADTATKGALYADLGLRLTYHPDRNLVLVEADVVRVCVRQCRRGDLNPYALFGHQALNLARLPIPPLRLVVTHLTAHWPA